MLFGVTSRSFVGWDKILYPLLLIFTSIFSNLFKLGGLNLGDFSSIVRTEFDLLIWLLLFFTNDGDLLRFLIDLFKYGFEFSVWN